MGFFLCKIKYTYRACFFIYNMVLYYYMKKKIAAIFLGAILVVLASTQTTYAWFGAPAYPQQTYINGYPASAVYQQDQYPVYTYGNSGYGYTAGVGLGVTISLGISGYNSGYNAYGSNWFGGYYPSAYYNAYYGSVYDDCGCGSYYGY